MLLPMTKIEGIAARNDVRQPLNHVFLEAPDPAPRRAEYRRLRALSGSTRPAVECWRAAAAATPPGYLVATDGGMLAAVPVELDDHDAPGYVTIEAIKAARKAMPRGHARVMANGAQVIPGGPTYGRPSIEDVGRFPDWRRVVPAMPDGAQPDIAINADLLAALQDALHSGKKTPHVGLRFARNQDGTIDPHGAIRVIGRDPAAIAVLMPVRW